MTSFVADAAYSTPKLKKKKKVASAYIVIPLCKRTYTEVYQELIVKSNALPLCFLKLKINIYIYLKHTSMFFLR